MNLLKFFTVFKLLSTVVFKYSIGIYRSLSAGGLPCCRFHPSCSEYILDCLNLHGLKGCKFIIKRLLRCHPWGKTGYDPVPEE